MKEIKRKKLSSALVQALGAGVALTVAAAAAQAQQTAQRVEKIEVTGSHVKRVDQETVAPVEIITREQIERTGQPTVAEVLRNIPANSGNSFAESFTNSFAPGASGIALRGLGQKTTLVLLNGRRVAGYGFAQNIQESFVDLNSIPSAAVERVEILKDGASAVYGSDAIAGVVNIILRKDFKGLEASIAGGYYESDWNEIRGAITAGFGDLARDRWSGFVTLDFFSRELLMLNETEHGRSRDRRGETGGRNHQSLTGGGTWRQLSATNALTNTHRAISECEAWGGFVTTGPQAVELGLIGAPPGNTAFNQPGNTFCSYDFNSQFTALPETDRVGLLSRFTREFNPNLTGYLELGLSRVQTFQTFQAPFFAGTTALQPTAAGLRPFVYNINFAPGSAGNPFNTNARYVGVHADLGTRNADITSDTLRLLLGAQYTIRTWDFDSAVGFSKNEVESLSINRTTHSGTAAVFGIPVATQPPVPLSSAARFNLDRPSMNTQAIRDEIRITFPRQSDSELKFVDTKANTEFGRLPGGPIGLALGAEYREEKLQDRPAAVAVAGNILAQGITATDGRRDSTALYAEASLPIIRAVEAQVAVRHDRYSDFGNTTNPKVGVKIKPHSTILVRANWGEGFRAPSLPEISQSSSTSFTTVFDPITNRNVNVSQVIFGNPNLQAEESESWTAGIIWEPTQNFSVSLNYYDIEWKNRVFRPSATEILTRNDPREVIRDPITNEPVTIFRPFVNRTKTETDGVDLEARYRMSTAMGRWTTRANVSYVDNFIEDGFDGAGNNGASPTLPRTRGQFAVDWDWRALSVTAAANYIRHYRHLFITPSQRAPQDPRFQNGVFPARVRSHTTYDVFAKYNLTKNLTVSGAIININDKKPPYDPAFTELYDWTIYDVRGRRISVGLTWKM